MNSEIKYIVSFAFSTQEVFPINDAEITFTHSLTDETKVFYQKKIKNKFKFSNKASLNITDFDFFKSFELSPTLKCTDFTLTILRKCNDIFVPLWLGEFSLTDAAWDFDQCTVLVTVVEKNIYECIKKNKSIEINILDVPNIITTSANLDFNYEYYYCYQLGFNPLCPLPGFQTATWSLMYNDSVTYKYQCVNYQLWVRVFYREVSVTACVAGIPQPPIGAGWALEQNNCILNQTAKYVRTAVNPVFGTPFALGWWNYINSIQELPPQPVFKNVTVTNTPQSEEFYLKQTQVFVVSLPQAYTFYFEVLLNTNSSYVWSLDISSPITAIITGNTNVCNIKTNFNGGGVIKIRLTETHGNGYVSVKIYTVNQSGSSFNLYNVDIKGQLTGCKNQIITLISTKPPTAVSGVITMNWTVGSGATIVSGQGTNIVQIQCGTTNFSAQIITKINEASIITILSSTVVAITVSDIPISPELNNITQVYPNEPQQFRMLSRPGAIYNIYRNSTSFGFAIQGIGFAVFNQNAPAVGVYCYLFKEKVNCGCNYQVIVPTIPNGTIGFLPAVYWCSNQSNIIVYNRNRTFKEVVEYVVQQLGCNIAGVVSDFFDWNAYGITPGYAPGINYVTGSTNRLTDITIAQKSDIINYLSSNPATKGLITFDKIERILAIAFNAFWYVDVQNILRIEHLSFFNRAVAYDANIAPNNKFNIAKNKYDYDKTKMPKFEKYLFAEMMFTDFLGVPIFYDSLCVDQDSERNKKEYSLDFVTTDLYSLFLDPVSANKVGFVLISNNVLGGVYTALTEVGMLSNTSVTNGHLSWANLHNNYHKHGRVLKQGFMNNILTTFITVRPTKKQKDIIIKICCTDIFDPLVQLYKTELGNGILDEAEENLKTGIIKMSLKHG